jgi:PTH1 family peptidyl-tRNA hydrolase
VKLIVGLGNPGIEYQFTPHNAGFMALDRIAHEYGVTIANRRSKALTASIKIGDQPVLLAKPETFMNLSGTSVIALLREFELTPANLLVVYDELALPLGTLRVHERGSAAGHNGVSSISKALGTEEWARIRIGIGKPPASDGREVKAGGSSYLLSPFRKQELAVLDEVLDRAQAATETVLTKGVAAAMNEFNRKAPRDGEKW